MSTDPRLARMRQPPAAAASSSSSATPPPPPPPPAAGQGQDTSMANALVENSHHRLQNGTLEDEDFKLKFCTVCASNNNRSMEAHLQLALADYPVLSFGTGSMVRLPGPSINQPNVYPFNTSSYDGMYKELESKDARLYRANGILNMLERNRGVKWGPERWQTWKVGEARTGHETDKGHEGVENGLVDIVITCEERCWDAVADDLIERAAPLNRQIHIFNVDIKDSHDEALVGGRAILDLADSLNAAAIQERRHNGHQGWEQGTGPGRIGFNKRVPEILASWRGRWPQFPTINAVAWF